MENQDTTTAAAASENEGCCCNNHADGNEECQCADNACKCCAEADEAIATEAPAALTADEKCAQLQDAHLRLAAEFDNYRKRSARERLEMLAFAGEDIIKGLLPIVDDFERAIKSADAAATQADAAVAAANPITEGTRLIYQKLLDYLKSKGLQEIDPAAVEFNTDFHDAVTKFPAATPEQKGKIIDTVQKGYKLNDKVIRFAKVVVGE